MPGLTCMEKYGTPLPDSVLESIRRNKVALKGPITTPIGTGFRSVNVALRHALDLYACVRPCKSYPGVRSRYQNIDLVMVRENSEDLYAGVEFDLESPKPSRLLPWPKGRSAMIGRSRSNLSRFPVAGGLSSMPLNMRSRMAERK